jgi:hypothetical protein
MFEAALRTEKKAKSSLTFAEGFFDSFADRVAKLGGCQVTLPPIEINGIKGSFTGPLTGLNAVSSIEDALGLDEDDERAKARRAKMPAQIVNAPKAKPRRITDVSEPVPVNGRT